MVIYSRFVMIVISIVIFTLSYSTAFTQEWLQLKHDSRHSGNVPEQRISTPLGLVGTVAMTDGIYTSPVISNGHVYVLDGSGVMFCINTQTLETKWTFKSEGGKGNCNNISSPAIIGDYIHFGTTAGHIYVLDIRDGTVVKKITCGEPIFSAPVVTNQRVYYATLGSQVYALEADGSVSWTWDFVKEIMGFTGDRWNGDDWLKHKDGRVNWKDHFCCTRNISAYENVIVIPAGGRTVFLQDQGDTPKLLEAGVIPNYIGSEYPATFGQSIGQNNKVYVQWHRRDNAGRTEILQLKDGKLETDVVPGTETAINLDGLLSFCSVSIRGDDVYRGRPEHGKGLCKHTPDSKTPQILNKAGTIASPILLKNHAVYGGLDGKLHVVPLDGEGSIWSFKTAFNKPITAPVAVSKGRIYFGCEDGYLYILGSEGNASLPTNDLQHWKIRSPLTGPYAGSKYNWYTNYGNLGNTNSTPYTVQPPLQLNWLRRVEGTVKHLPVCGGGRMYTHTAEGIISAVEQETGRLLWRRYWPNVYLSFTSPIYHEERLLVPQAGMKQSHLRCLDAATGELLWEGPFTGSPSWSRQAPPVIYKGMAFYASGSGEYAAQGSEKPFIFRAEPVEAPEGKEIMSWIYTHDNPYYPKDNKPLIWAWNLQTGEHIWQKDFSDIGSGGNDCGLALMDGVLYYSTFFGYAADKKKRRGLPSEANGLTAAIDPMTGDVIWSTTKYYVTAGCTLSAKDGRLYMGGYNQPHEGTDQRYIWCLNAEDGSLVWRSDPVESAVNVVSVGEDFLFSNAIRGDGHVFDKKTGKIVNRFNNNYACTRFTVSGPYLMGTNMDMVNLLDENQLVSSGPAIDSRECLGATVSNGRIFYTSQASGLQTSCLGAKEASKHQPVWRSTGKD